MRIAVLKGEAPGVLKAIRQQSRRVQHVGKLLTVACLVLYAVYLLLVPVWWGTSLDGPPAHGLPSLDSGPGASSSSSSSTVAPALSRIGARRARSSSSGVVLSAVPPPRDILVLYVFAYTDPEYYHNLAYFVHEAIQGDTRAQYYIAVQKVAPLELGSLPELPAHARYVPHDNECYDWGTFGWLLLHSGLVGDWGGYKHFFFINSSVRGPFLPAYARGTLHWTEPFLGRLSDTVKLVGSTISCEGSPLGGDMNGTWRRNPHVQSYAVATDRVGLEVLLADPHVFTCHGSRWDAIYWAELGSSAALLGAGYNLGCLMVRYEGVDWRDKGAWGCNGRLSPTGESWNDGISLDPLEVVFVKVKSHMLVSHLSVTRKAVKYQAWQEAAENGGLNASALAANEYLTDLPRFKTPHVLEARARGAKCFDFDHYASHNPDLSPIAANQLALWRHFVYYGQFESRPFRYICDLDYEKLTSW